MSRAQAALAMVDTQLVPRGIRDPRVLDALASVPRDLFVPDYLRYRAYADEALPIGHGQTISQPYIVALMTEALRLQGDETVLEIGTGSGYQAAILCRLVRRLYTVETVPELVETARERLAMLGCANIEVILGDGSLGRPEHAPYDAIICTAAAPDVPPPLRYQLRDGGRLVLPIGRRWEQQLVLVTREGPRFHSRDLAFVAFVPLLGQYGWQETGEKRAGLPPEECE